MHGDAQFAGSSSVPAHVEMMGLIGMGNNPVSYTHLTSVRLTPEQREHVYREIRAKRDSKNGKPVFTVDVQNDAEFVCGGKGLCERCV